MKITDPVLSDCNRRLAATMDAIKAAEELIRQGEEDAAAEMLLQAVREGRKVQSVFRNIAGDAPCPSPCMVDAPH